MDDRSVDERLFHASYTSARRHAEVGDYSRAAVQMRDALALWRGRALEDVGSDTLTGEATRLEEVRVRALEQLVEWEFAQERYAELVPELRVWTQDHPYNEFLHACLAEALHQSSRTPDALDVLRWFRQRLDQELGLRPGPGLLQLEARLLRQPPVRHPGGPAVDLSALRAIQTALIDLSEAVQALINDAGAQRVAVLPLPTGEPESNMLASA